MANHTCTNKRERFCLLCGLFLSAKAARAVTVAFAAAYEAYYGARVPSGWYVPPCVCTTCYSGLVDWSAERRDHAEYKEPFKWVEPQSSVDCYFCTSNLSGAKMQRRNQLPYSVTSLSKTAVMHTDDFIPL